MDFSNIPRDALRLPVAAILDAVHRRLLAAFPDRAVVHTSHHRFHLDAWVRAGQAERVAAPGFPVLTALDRSEDGAAVEDVLQGWHSVRWSGGRADVLALSILDADGCSLLHHWLVAERREEVDRLFLEVLRWNETIHGEVLVFSRGYFEKSEELYQSIGRARLADLVLGGGLKEDLEQDLTRFLGAKALYERHGIPYKRGLLLIGPPGNGKTHALKALVRMADRPCLYVKTFKGRRTEVEENVVQVFERARRTAPCVLVLEDLDCLIDDESRSVLLNELDGFSANSGILTLATTNHPERLDRSILDRPSRFDRKFHFPLPGRAAREEYLRRWSQGAEAALRLSEAALLELAELTGGFTFAYLKELVLSSLMAWTSAGAHARMDEVARGVLSTLRSEMASAHRVLPATPSPRPIGIGVEAC